MALFFCVTKVAVYFIFKPQLYNKLKVLVIVADGHGGTRNVDQ